MPELNNVLFGPDEQARYLRQLQLPGFAAKGQASLRAARVLLVGVGGLGCPAAQYLAAAGVGRLTLVDGDSVALSNLARQILFTEADIGRNKAAVAASRLSQQNSLVTLAAVTQHLAEANAEALIAECDIVLDCTDNFYTRYLLNDHCHRLQKPWVYASVLQFAGQLALFQPNGGCFRCLFPEVSEVADCNQAGVLGVVPGIVGNLQALTAIKYLADLDGGKLSTLFQFSALDLQLKPIKLQPSRACPLCGGGVKTEWAYTQSGSGRSDVFMAAAESWPGAPLSGDYQIAAAHFYQFLERYQPQLIDLRSPAEHAAANLGGINIPLAEVTQWQGWQPGRAYLLYCQSGRRSQLALQRLLAAGLPAEVTLKNLAGGCDALAGWRSQAPGA
ncbi:HesA/MoeB/ThiF family protein [Halioxenophilus sp. WMMB6]|uniref:HesA/MoeB/ThiF family protein n=1 Tax=Halioxenophilus sp. WMMB6 TaxID=3073815 RepID=UPI00295E3671|nr:HesA/MoeB/ThiF family protein [Halioxenophilus sp. WMMB6]